MSIPKRMKVACPQCKRQFETTVFESLNGIALIIYGRSQAN